MAENTEELIREQVEFYFSDSNYLTDKFLKQKAAENEGYVPVATLATFSRIKRLTEDVTIIANALKKSDKLILSQDEKMVKRKAPLPTASTLDERSVYIKGLPEESTGVNIDAIKNFFSSSSSGKVMSVRLRRQRPDKIFKGSAFVEFETKEEAEAASKKTNLTWKGQDKPLLIKMKKQYFEDKKQEQKKRKREKQSKDLEEKEKEKKVHHPGCILVVTGLDKDLTREELKSQFAQFGEVKFVDMKKEKTHIRFATLEAAKSALEEKSKDKKEGVDYKVLEGKEEEDYYEAFIFNSNKGRRRTKKRKTE